MSKWQHNLFCLDGQDKNKLGLSFIQKVGHIHIKIYHIHKRNSDMNRLFQLVLWFLFILNLLPPLLVHHHPHLLLLVVWLIITIVFVFLFTLFSSSLYQHPLLTVSNSETTIPSFHFRLHPNNSTQAMDSLDYGDIVVLQGVLQKVQPHKSHCPMDNLDCGNIVVLPVVLP